MKIKSILFTITHQGTIASNSIYSLISLSSQFFSNLVLIFILARLVSVDILGEIFYAIGFMNIVLVLASYGFNNLIIREISQKKFSVSELFFTMLVSKIIVFFITTILVYIFIITFGLPLQRYAHIWPYVGAAFANSMISSLVAIRKGSNDFKSEFTSSIFRIIAIFVITITGFFIFSASTGVVGWARLISGVASLVFGWFIVNQAITKENPGIKYRVDPTKIKYLLKVGFPFALQAILGAAYFQIDILILGKIANTAEVAYYQSAMQIVTMGMLIPLALIQAYYPRLASSLSADKRTYQLQNKMMVVLIVIGLGLSLVVGLLSPIIIGLLYGEKMSHSITLLQTLTIIFLIRSVASGLGISLLSVGLQKAQVYAGIIATIASVLLNILLIPKFGSMGAAYSNVSVNLLVLLVYYFWWKLFRKG